MNGSNRMNGMNSPNGMNGVGQMNSTQYTLKEKENTMTSIVALLAAVFVALLGFMIMLTIKYNNSENNAVIVYYNGYESPRIRYRFDDKGWGNLEGEAIPANTDNIYQNYKYKAVIPMQSGHKYILVMFRDEQGNIDDNGGENYKLTKGKYLFDNGNLVKIDNKFKVATFTSSSKSTFVGSQVAFTITTMNGQAPYNYKFAVKDVSGAINVIQDYSTAFTANWTPQQAGVYSLIAYVQDSKGKEVTKELSNFIVTSLAVKEIQVNPATPQRAGTTISLGMDIENSANLELTCFYEIKGEGGTTKIDADAQGAAEWTPTEGGNYTIVGHIQSGEYKAELSKEYEIEEEIQLTKLIIYYRGIENPSMYYKKTSEDQDFTCAAMTPDTTMDGYNYRAEVDVEYNSQVVLYFSDGFAVVDDNNTMMYVVQPGYFGISNGQVSNLSVNQGEYTGDDEIMLRPNDDEDNDDGGNWWGNLWPRD